MSPERVNKLAAANRALTTLGYVTYPLLLVLLMAFEPGLLKRCIIVPAAGFIVVTVVRLLVNEPRPYENGGPAPLIPKTTKGKSFPSRHAFCMFMIAFTWMVWQPLLGIVLLVCAVFMGYCRVTLGVHYLHDVVAAIVLAAAFAAIGYWPIISGALA